MKKLTRLFVASLCMAALTSCGEQRKQVVYEEQGWCQASRRAPP